MKKLPIGLQNFRKIIENDYLYGVLFDKRHLRVNIGISILSLKNYEHSAKFVFHPKVCFLI